MGGIAQKKMDPFAVVGAALVAGLAAWRWPEISNHLQTTARNEKERQATVESLVALGEHRRRSPPGLGPAPAPESDRVGVLLRLGLVSGRFFDGLFADRLSEDPERALGEVLRSLLSLCHRG